VPFAVSQKGIAEGIDIRITHIPRGVQKLLNDEYLTEFKTHFRGHLRKRKAYFLTERGMEKALALKESVGSQLVSLKSKEGRTIEKKLSEMYEDFGSMVNFYDFYTLFTKHGVLEESILDAYRNPSDDAGKFGASGFKDQRHSIPAPSMVLGRDSELITVNEWIDSSDKRVMVITGDKGMGKSTLAAAAVRNHFDDHFIIWNNFLEGDPWETLIDSFVEISAMNNFLKLEKYAKQSSRISPGKAYEILAEDLGDLQMIVVLTNVHSIKGEMSDMGTWLLPLVKYLPDWKIILTTSEILPMELRSSDVLTGKYEELKLTGLDSSTSLALLGSKLSEKEFESIYEYTEGNPLYLKAIRDLSADGKLDLKNFRPEELSLLRFLKMQEELE
jgi:hypothetical protein